MAETSIIIAPPAPQPAQPDPPAKSKASNAKPVHAATPMSLPTTLSNAQGIIDTALASRKLSVKENPTLQMKWEQMYQRLLAYKEKHGNCLVPNRYKEDRSLGQWVSAQRRQFKQLQSGEDSPMTLERAALLEEIGFVWATLERGHVPWEVRFEELMAYKHKYGDCLVPIGYKENPQLSSWVSTQRQEMKLLKEGKPTRLTEDRIRLLDDGGFVWESQRGKRGGRRKNRLNREYEDNSEPPSSPSAGSLLRPCPVTSRAITDSEAPILAIAPVSGRVVTDTDRFADAECDSEAPPKKRKIMTDSLLHRSSGTASFPFRQALPAPATGHLANAGIFDDADDEPVDPTNKAALDTYFNTQRMRPSTLNFSHMSSQRKDHAGGALLRRVSNIPIHPLPRFAHRKLSMCDTAKSEEGQKSSSQEHSQQEAAVALLSVGRGMA